MSFLDRQAEWLNECIEAGIGIAAAVVVQDSFKGLSEVKLGIELPQAPWV